MNILNKYDTPLFGAAAEGNLEVIKVLINYGADVNKANVKGVTPYQIAERFGRADVVEYLLEHGAIK